MKYRKFKLILIILSFVNAKSFCQSVKKDTIYYLIDTSKVSIIKDNNFLEFEFNSPCKTDGQKLGFSSWPNSANRYITKNDIQKFRLLSTKSLYKEFCKDLSSHYYSKKYITFFIITLEKNYLLSQVSIWTTWVEDQSVIVPKQGKK